METQFHLISFIKDIDKYLIILINTYGSWTYLILSLIIFLETGIIIAAFLPGDSLLVASGVFIANSPNSINIHLLFFLLALAAIFGNTFNYLTGRWLGPKVFRFQKSWLFNKKRINEAHHVYERWGGKFIILASFFPILRTFSPFVAGVGYMTFSLFLLYSIIGAILWVGILLYGSYLFGNLTIVKAHFLLIIMAIILISLIPATIKLFRK